MHVTQRCHHFESVTLKQLVLVLCSAGVHGPAGLPVASPGQGGDQRDEGATRTQREHAEEHPAQPRGTPLPGEGPGQRGQHETC